MREFKLIREPRQLTFMGDKIYRYRVFNKMGLNLYYCVTTKNTINEMLTEIHKMFGNLNGYKVVCNGDVIYTHKYVKIVDHRKILDKTTDVIYLNIYDFIDQFNITKGEAVKKIRKLSRFTYID
jgi:hypothetical protein